MKGYVQRLDDTHRQMVWHAWHVGLLSQMDPRHYVPIDELLGEKQPAEERLISNEQMLVEMRKLAKRSPGLTVKQVG